MSNSVLVAGAKTPKHGSMERDRISIFRRFARLLGCLFATSMMSSAIKPYPAAAVDEWIVALEGDHDSLNVLTCDRMMLALANSARLNEVSSIINEFPDKGESSSIRKVELIGKALTSLAMHGYVQEAAKVDAAVVARTPTIRWSNAILDSALRLADAGESDALVYMAETLMLVPGCNRTLKFDLKREQAMSARTIKVAPIDSPSQPASTTLLPILASVEAIDLFRELAEMRVAAVPEDFKSVRVLTLATLIDTGDDPALWKRIADAEGFFRGRDFVALKDSMQLCYQLKIPAPHLCASAEQLFDEADHNGTSFSRHEFSLILAALWKDIGRIDEARKWQEEALVSLLKEPKSGYTRFFKEYAGVLVVSLDDERMLPELDCWIAALLEVLKEPSGWGERYYRHVLTACEWALAMEVPEPAAKRWFLFADEMAGHHVERTKIAVEPQAYAIRWHFNLLLSAGMRVQAEELLASFTRASEGRKAEDLDPGVLSAELLAASRERKPLVIPDAAGAPIRSVHWSEGTEYLNSSGSVVFIADVYPPLEGGEVPMPEEKNAPLAEGGKIGLPSIAGPNLIPGGWRWQRESAASNNLAPRNIKDGSIRLGYRGGNSGGNRHQLISGIFPLDADQDYFLSGRIRAFGRGGVSIQFLHSDGSIASTQRVTEHISSWSPGERWFRVNLIRGTGVREGMRVPEHAASARLILTGSLSVQNRWSDLFIGRISDEE